MQQFDEAAFRNAQILKERLASLAAGLESLGVAIGSNSFDENTTAGLGFAVESLGLYTRDILCVDAEVLGDELAPTTEPAADQGVRRHD